MIDDERMGEGSVQVGFSQTVLLCTFLVSFLVIRFLLII
jgi:hypothetical protein